MAGGVNNLGTTLGPLVVSIAIFGIGATAETTLDIEAVKLPYLALGAWLWVFYGQAVLDWYFALAFSDPGMP